jgi:hypothetical protein
MSSPIVGPIAPYNNPPIEPQFYQPSQFIISAVTLGQTTTITTTVNHNYVIGQLVRLLFPGKYGCGLLNEQTGYVIIIPAANQVTINLYSLGSDQFIPSPTFLPFQSQTPPQIVAVGENNSGQISSSGRINIKTYIPGSFINISP